MPNIDGARQCLLFRRGTYLSWNFEKTINGSRIWSDDSKFF